MRVVFHPDFPGDVRRYAGDYVLISEGLAKRFKAEVGEAIEAIKSSPTSAGHYLNLGSKIVPDIRRRNLRAFPFFLIYGLVADQIIIGSLIPSRSDPLTWLSRFTR